MKKATIFAAVLEKNRVIVDVVDVGLNRESLQRFADSFNETAYDSRTVAKVRPWSDRLAAVAAAI